MQIQVIVVMVLLLVIISLGFYLVGARRRKRRSQETGEEPKICATIQPDTSTRTEEADVIQHGGEAQIVEVELVSAITVEASPPAQEQVTSEEILSQSATEKDSHIQDTLIEVGEHSPELDLVKENRSPEECNNTTGTIAIPKELTQFEATGDLSGKVDEDLQQGTHISPGKRGGRFRKGTQEGKRDSAIGPRKRNPKPEIVCWKREREWVLGVEIPEELCKAAEMDVCQNMEALTEDTFRKGCWRLMNLGGQIDVCTSDGDVKIDIGESNYLVFKLSGADLTEGRYVKRPSAGSYVVIAPEGWERDEKLAGKAPAAPEPVCLGGYHAHFFDLVGDNSSQIAFNDRSGSPIKVVSGGPRFAFVGHELHDASERLGPLFGCSPPRIQVSNGNWADVGTIVVGEEGSGRERWRESLSPNPNLEEQQLPDKIPNIAVGWYFVRLYNLRDELIDSMDFRFVAGLRRITVDKEQPFPSEAGHTEATVEFEHDSSYHLEPEGVSPETLAINRNDEKMTAIIPPNASYDRTSWFVGTTASRRVRIEILVERIWWTIRKVNEPPSQWQDRCLFLSCDDFKATSDNAIWLRLPKCRYTDCVTVGFQRARSREFALKVGENMLAIPLRDFSDSQEIAGRTVSHSLTVWLKVNDNEYECAIVRIGAENVAINDDVAHIPTPQEEPVPTISVPFTVRQFITYLLRKPWFKDEVSTALSRLEKSAPDHCRNGLAKWREELRKQKPNFSSIWISLRAIDKYLRPVPARLANLKVPEAAFKDIFYADKILDHWWSGL